MAKKYRILLGIAAVVMVLTIRDFSAGHQTPPGQPQLLAITSQSLPQFAEEFNRSAYVKRVGASAVADMSRLPGGEFEDQCHTAAQS